MAKTVERQLNATINDTWLPSTGLWVTANCVSYALAYIQVTGAPLGFLNDNASVRTIYILQQINLQLLNNHTCAFHGTTHL